MIILAAVSHPVHCPRVADLVSVLLSVTIASSSWLGDGDGESKTVNLLSRLPLGLRSQRPLVAAVFQVDARVKLQDGELYHRQHARVP